MLTLDLVPGEDVCRAQLADICRLSGSALPEFPCSESAALTLLTSAGQFTATPAILARCESMGWFQSPGDEWSARDVCLFGYVLDLLRFWRPTPSIHDAKKGERGINFELMLQEGRVKDVAASMAEDGIDLRRVMLAMLNAETRDQRETAYYSIAALLHARGIVI